jgi:hypothetical protein
MDKRLHWILYRPTAAAEQRYGTTVAGRLTWQPNILAADEIDSEAAAKRTAGLAALHLGEPVECHRLARTPGVVK